MYVEKKQNAGADQAATQKDRYDVVVLVGSLRKASLTLKMAKVLKSLSAAYLDLDILDIGKLPMYNEDLETGEPPLAWYRYRQRVKRAHAILFVTPEYNRSVPAVLKNAIDVGSAPHGCNAYEAKPAGIVSLSPGSIGAFGANHHLRQSLVFFNAPAMLQPEVYIGGSERLFDQAGDLVDMKTRDFLAEFMRAFARWIQQHR